MPQEVTGLPMGGAIVRLSAVQLAREAFGEECGEAIDQHYEAIRNQ